MSAPATTESRRARKRPGPNRRAGNCGKARREMEASILDGTTTSENHLVDDAPSYYKRDRTILGAASYNQPKLKLGKGKDLSHDAQAEGPAADSTSTSAHAAAENIPASSDDDDEVTELQHVENLLTGQLQLNVEDRARIGDLQRKVKALSEENLSYKSTMKAAKAGTKAGLSASNAALKKQLAGVQDTLDFERDLLADYQDFAVELSMMKQNFAKLAKLGRAIDADKAELKRLRLDLAGAETDGEKKRITEALEGTQDGIDKMRRR